MAIGIRPACEQDFDALCFLYYEFHEFYARTLPDRVHSLGARDDQDWSSLREHLASVLGDNDAAIFLAVAADQPVGLVEVHLRRDDATDSLGVPCLYGYVPSLVVLEPWRRSGAGKQLMAAAEQWAAGKGAAELRLDIWEVETGPLHFYEKIGYRTIKRALVKALRR